MGHVPSAGNLSLYVKMTHAYGWGEHNKDFHAATTRGIHIFWALCYPSGQQKATFRSQTTLRETKPVRGGVGIIKREERWKEQSSVGTPELSWELTWNKLIEPTKHGHGSSRRAPASCSHSLQLLTELPQAPLQGQCPKSLREKRGKCWKHR